MLIWQTAVERRACTARQGELKLVHEDEPSDSSHAGCLPPSGHTTAESSTHVGKTISLSYKPTHTLSVRTHKYENKCSRTSRVCWQRLHSIFLKDELWYKQMLRLWESFMTSTLLKNRARPSETAPTKTVRPLIQGRKRKLKKRFSWPQQEHKDFQSNLKNYLYEDSSAD